MKTYTIELTDSEIAMICFALGSYTAELIKRGEHTGDRLKDVGQLLEKLHRDDAAPKS